MYGDILSTADTATITIVSIVTVFIVLLIISYLIDLNAMLVARFINKEKKTTHSAPAVSSSPSGPAAAPAPQVKDNRKAILAAAAIAAYLSTDAGNIVVKRITRVNDSDTLWAKNALMQSMVESNF